MARVVFLYVGQGSSVVVLAADGETYLSHLIDINLDKQRGGIDVPRLMADLLEDAGLDVFANTHPHVDHLRGVKELADALEIKQVWHSGHKPGKDHDDAYQHLQDVIQKVNESGGSEVKLKASRDAQRAGDAEYFVLSPAEYVSDDIGDEDPDTRYRRIHEQCAVLKFGGAETWVVITGDADRDAWEKHITEYHKERLGAAVFDAPHHGSRTFFRYDKEQEAYLEALESIGPDYVIISAPTKEESPHDHPHDDALELYEKQVGKVNILHTGAKRYSFICDIYRDGGYEIVDDKGELATTYGLSNGDDSGGDGNKSAAAPAIVRTRVDERPMGQK